MLNNISTRPVKIINIHFNKQYFELAYLLKDFIIIKKDTMLLLFMT